MAAGKLRILFVEDNTVDAALIRGLLSSGEVATAEVDHVKLFKEALERLKQQRYDVILLDLGLPDSHGIETLVRLRAATTKTPVVVLTGYDDEGFGSTVIHKGARDFLTKGEVDAQGLGRALRFAVEGPPSMTAIQSPALSRRFIEDGVGPERGSPPPGDGEGSFELRFIPPGETEQRLIGGNYRTERLLGQGGMGIVYQGTDTALDREVAIKVLHPALASSIESEERFNREAKTLAALDHPAIVPIYAYGRDGDEMFFVMPFVHGTPFHDYLRGMPLSVAWWLPYFRSVCEALDYAHGHGVIHRDLKPANIMLLQGEARAKVLDFGIAMGPATRRLTEVGNIVGTPLYMSPEQGLDSRKVGPRSDQYSLGVIVYEVLTGKTLFDAAMATAVLFKHHEEAPKPPWEVNPTLHREVGEVVLRALAKKPEERYESCLAFYHALETAYEASAAVEAKTGSKSGRRAWDPSAKVGLGEYVPELLLVDLGLAGTDKEAATRLAGATDAMAEPANAESLRALEALDALLLDDHREEEVLEACRVLTGLGDAAIAVPLRHLFAELLGRGLVEGASEPTAARCQSLALVSSRSNLSAWRQLLADPEPAHRRWALEALPLFFEGLGQGSRSPAWTQLAQLLFWSAEDADEDVAVAALRTLASLGIVEAVDVIFERFRQSSSASVKLTLIDVLRTLVTVMPIVPERVRAFLRSERAHLGRSLGFGVQPLRAELLALSAKLGD